MPVRKFRSVEEMDGLTWREPGDPALWRAIAALWSFSSRAFPRRFPPGVHRYRTLASAQAQRDAWEAADFQRLWSERGPSRRD